MALELTPGSAIIALSPLTEDETIERARCEAALDRLVESVSEARLAMASIVAGKLYRSTHASFESYCSDLWKISAGYGYQLAKQGETLAAMSHGSHLPAPESGKALRALSLVPEAQRADVWGDAVALAGGAAATGRQVQEAIAAREAVDLDPPSVLVADACLLSDVKQDVRNPFDDQDARVADVMSIFRNKKEESEAPRLDIGSPKPARETDEATRDGDEWFTPRQYVDAARGVMVTIELDPASCETAQAVVNADFYYSPEKGEDGLMMPWEVATLWLNPPYSNAGAWIERLVQEYKDGNVRQAIVLVNAKTETSWFGLLWEHAALCFVRGRISFTAGDGGKSQTGRTGSVFAYLGPNPDTFHRVFGAFGVLARRVEVA